MVTRENLNKMLANYLNSKGITTLEVCLTNTCFSIMVSSLEIVEKIQNLFDAIKNQINIEKNELVIEGIEFEKWDGNYFVELPLNIKFK